MLRVLRSRAASLVLLTAFLVGQPAALCAALCAVEQHHAAMPGMASGAMASHVGACHAGVSDAARHDQLQALSPMAPTRAAAMAAAPDRRIQPVRVRPAFPRSVFRVADPPPPRLV